MDASTAVVSVDNSQSLLSRNVETFRETRQALGDDRPDVVLLDCYGLMGLVVILLARWYGVPVVARMVGDTWRILREEYGRTARENRRYLEILRHELNLLVNRIIYSQVTGFLVVSEALKDTVHRQTGCPRGRIGVVPVPVTTDTLRHGSAASAREQHEIDEELVVLTVTNLAFRSKYEGTRDVFRELLPTLERRTDVAWVVAGGGTFYSHLRSFLDVQVDDPSLRQRIYTLGHVEDVVDLYAVADVFVYVSYLDGYPNVVLEAQTAALPVIANAAYGMTEQITDGETGFLIAPSEDGALRHRLEQLLEHPSERTRLGNGGRERVVSENSPGVVSDQVQAFLSELLEDNR
jgi:glycosyltransferase involved in cell wall biosynthesis